MRRPSPLLKSPSFDSESSDPPNTAFPVTCYGNDSCNVSRTLTPVTQRQSGIPQIGTINISDRNTKHFYLASAFRYRTDSDTTDDQCIPESLSEGPGHDSALDTTEDIDEEDVEEEELNDASPNIDGPKVPQLYLSEAVQSSTESEKTVILDCQLIMPIDDEKDSMDTVSSLSLMAENVLSSDNSLLDDQVIKSSMLSLPEIVILPGTPSASSPSAPSSPTSHSSSSSSSVSIITAAGLATISSGSNIQISVQTSINACESSVLASPSLTNTKCNNPCPNLPFCKANSIPPHVLSIVPNSSLDYEQLVTYNTNSNNSATTSTAASCCSSRCESPLSDRGVIKCSSLISLHLRNIDPDGNALGFPICGANFTSETALDDDNCNTQVNKIRFCITNAR